MDRGVEHIARQKAIIENRRPHGRDITLFRELLATLEETQRLHVRHRDLIEKELDQALTEEIRWLVALVNYRA